MHKNHHSHFIRVLSLIGGSLALATWLLWLSLGGLRAETAVTDFGYGFNVAAWDVSRLQAMGFNWMKVFNGPGSRLPVNILLRVDANAGHFNNLSAFGDSVAALAQSQKGFVDAYEIGNEPNLDASYGWTAAPNAADYAALLCEAYGRIKAIDPNARVISAGLAPTGRVTGNWNGHPGHNGLYQDEREFFKEFIAAGGGNCLDGVGYHPYGFSADFDAAPDIYSADSTQNCVNGFCFRGTEKIYEIMQTNGLGGKIVWATEFGWIVNPPANCLSDPGWQGRQWQIVSEQKQADNLVGAFEYAAANWPWMEAMFIFNLNFNQAGYVTCEQMRYYSVQGRPAEAALTAMPKVTAPKVGELAVSPSTVAAMITRSQPPFTQTVPIQLQNVGTAVFTYTAVLTPGSLAPTLSGSSSAPISPTASAWLTVTIASSGRPTGTYTAWLTITATSGTTNAPTTIPLNLFIVDQIHKVYLPVVKRP